jgi:hypothetical protein
MERIQRQLITSGQKHRTGFIMSLSRVLSNMESVGVTSSCKEMMGTFTSLPFMKDTPFDIDHYVTGKTLDGLFYVMAQEEKKIRTDPSARITELLEKVLKK